MIGIYNILVYKIPVFGPYAPPISPEKELIDLDQGNIIAESFARERCPAFWNVSDIRRVKYEGSLVENFPERFVYYWEEIYYNPNKNTPIHLVISGQNFIRISINPFTGNVSGFDERLACSANTGVPPVDLTPMLTEEQAQKIAEDHFPAMHVERGYPKLVIMTYNESLPRLTWLCSMTRNVKVVDPHIGHFVNVDAHNGTILLAV